MASALLPWHWALIALGAAIVLLALVSWLTGPRRYDLRDRVVVITGGSSGIGKAVAKLALAKGAHVALLARRQEVLQAAAAELAPSKRSPAQRITTHAVDVSNDAATEATMRSISAAHGGVIDVLVNSAGMSLPREFERTSAKAFTDVYSANVLGTRNATAAALPYMTRGGRIVFVSSQAGQSGIFGYTAYSASKFALSGFAQALQMEVYTRDIRVSLCFPPDTDTPMLAAENLEKPAITRMLSEATAMVPPEVVAAKIISGTEKWRPLISIGFDGWLLSTLTVGFGPAGSLLSAVVQVFTAGLVRLIALAYVQLFYWQIRNNDKRHSHATSISAPTEATGAALQRPLVESAADDQKTK